MKGAFYFIDSEEAAWNTGEPGLGYKVRVKGGYFPVAPTDTMTDIRNEMCQLLERCGIRVERHHHEVATAGQGEINFRFDTLTRAADNLLLFKYIVRNVAKKYGKTATFMPKPIVGDNGSGMHTHQSLFNGDTPLFYEKGGYANLSELALYYIGGILKHAPALTAPLPPCCSPAWTASATGSIPTEHGFGPIDKNIYELSDEEKKNIKSVPASLDEALDALEEDHAFLLAGDVFTKDVIETWIALKREEARSVNRTTHPKEYELYYDL